MANRPLSCGTWKNQISASPTRRTGEDAVDDQRVDGCVDVPRREGGVHRGGQGINAHFQQVLERQTDDAEGE